MLTINDLKAGAFFVLDGDPFRVEKHDFIKMAQSKGIMRITARNLKTGQVLEKTFKGSEKLEEADMKKTKASFLYQEGANYYFMDQETYDQFFVNERQIGDKKNFLKENLEVEVLHFNDTPISIELPKKVRFAVASAPGGARGDTATNIFKTVKLENGMELKAPLFVKAGDAVIVNTETGEYVERA